MQRTQQTHAKTQVASLASAASVAFDADFLR